MFKVSPQKKRVATKQPQLQTLTPAALALVVGGDGANTPPPPPHRPVYYNGYAHYYY
jgi:hypothetical protein